MNGKEDDLGGAYSSNRRYTRLSSFNLELFEKPAEEVTDIWLDEFDPDQTEVELAEDIIELALRYDDSYPFSMFENQLFRRLSDNELRVVFGRLSQSNSRTSLYIKAMLESPPD